MCKNHNPRKIDKCMERLIKELKTLYEIVKLEFGDDKRVVACCCGHGKYPMTIVVWDKDEEEVYDLISGETIPRKRRFYRKDSRGYYFIPEVTENAKMRA